ncbi:sensor histidine kinase [uncultured Aquimarina sp.]|uniref:tetratricopeptide repeat-containing sensor histidine kinase n=1 Tax=uncultured Aquimarina sp. TaxID=575652 RepID=UPI002626F112|nr:sensor histidine kinase [uncultured Aquimarina sp.]
MLLFLLLLLLNNAFGQNKTVDSLLLELNQVTTKKQVVNTLNEIAWQFRNINLEKGLVYAYRAEKISDSINYQEGYLTSLNRIGILYINQGKYIEAKGIYIKILEQEKKDEDIYGIARAQNQLGIINKRTGNINIAIEYTQNSMSNFETLGKQKLVATTANNIGSMYKQLGDYENAQQYYLKSLDIREKIGDKRGIAYSYLNLGAFNNFLENYDIALKDLKKSEKILIEFEDQLGLSKIYNNIGISYFNLNNLDESLIYYNQSLVLKEKLGILSNRNILYNNIGLIYEKKGQLDKALDYYKKSISNDSGNLSGNYNNIGNVLRKKNKLNESIEFYHKSLEQAQKNNKAIVQLEVLKNISDIYAQIGSFNESVKYNNLFNALRDSIELSYKNTMEVRVNYEEEKKRSELLLKDKEISQANLETSISENKRKNTLLYGLLIGFVLLAILFFSIWRTSKQKQRIILAEKNEKINQQKIQELLKNQELKSINTMINAQEKERKRIAQDLHDRLGSMLSMVKIHFKSVEDVKENNADQYNLANNLLDNACEEIRKIAHNMSSGVLSKFGLIPALNELKTTIEKSNQIEIDFIDHGIDDRMKNEIEINVYRIIQELISNILRHANATEVTIQILKNHSNLGVMVIDNGIGFDKNNHSYKEGMGLLNIRSRVDKLEGEMTIDSGKGNGTTININIPVL